ncbi:MAG: 2-C-methyl-D-erythritol 4-phosphate cytidylyltransferase [Erysipelotrichaceae bacterium]|nr:2-C-methyl-D-erythritol 4-phosphate cytidylyltransferase [Erysipelotrichaceae bacterium]
MVSVVLVMAGKGSRMNKNVNKVLLPLGQKLVFEHSLDTFKSLGCEVICVVSKDDYPMISERLKHVKFTFGGQTRQESVMNGLKECSGDYVLIHDAARPFISESVVREIISSYKLNEAILCHHNVKDTIKCFTNDGVSTLNRASLIAASTPQCASLEVLNEVYQKASNDAFVATDDLSLIERYRPDIKINYVLANEESFKITTPLDYELAKLIVEVKK